jgi:ribosomal protein S18 acetylase RimI-like enzyme
MVEARDRRRIVMRIDTATVADAETLAELNEHVHRLHLQHAPAFFSEPTREAAAAAFGVLLARDDTRAFIASVDDGAVGYVLVVTYERPASAFSPARRTLYIDQIAVAPGARRRGVGRELVGAALGWARAASINDIEVDTWAFNTAAQAFFTSFGFRAKTGRLWMKLQG